MMTEVEQFRQAIKLAGLKPPNLFEPKPPKVVSSE